MNRIGKDELGILLGKHRLWLENDPEGERANLRGADLNGADLNGANLSEADLSEADLSEANLWGADLSGANLSGANLMEADLWGANLRGADLRGADLRGANLSGANLRGANLSGANLRRADLNGANLWGADLREAKNLRLPIACPEEGSFTAFKKAGEHYIVKLLVPEDALRCSATGRKCRCSKAEVLSITNLDGTDSGLESVPSRHDESFVYAVGQTVSVSDFDTDRWNECSAGIHFFITRQEAVDY